MFPNERGAILNDLAHGYSGKGNMSGGGSLTWLLDEEALSRIANSAWDRLWARFITFGSISAGFITLLMIFRLIKFVLDTIIHGYVLYSLYGWSVHILGALWNSLTQLLLHLGKDFELEKPKEKSSPSEPSAPSAAAAPFTCTTQKYQVECVWSENEAIDKPYSVENKLYPMLNETNNAPLSKRSII